MIPFFVGIMKNEFSSASGSKFIKYFCNLRTDVKIYLRNAAMVSTCLSLRTMKELQSFKLTQTSPDRVNIGKGQT